MSSYRETKTRWKAILRNFAVRKDDKALFRGRYYCWISSEPYYSHILERVRVSVRFDGWKNIPPRYMLDKDGIGVVDLEELQLVESSNGETSELSLEPTSNEALMAEYAAKYDQWWQQLSRDGSLERNFNSRERLYRYLADNPGKSLYPARKSSFVRTVVPPEGRALSWTESYLRPSQNPSYGVCLSTDEDGPYVQVLFAHSVVDNLGIYFDTLEEANLFANAVRQILNFKR